MIFADSYYNFCFEILKKVNSFPVTIDSYEGFGGPALIVGKRETKNSTFKVRLLDRTQPDFWAFDNEIVELRNEENLDMKRQMILDMMS